MAFNRQQSRRDARRITATRNKGVTAWSRKPSRTTESRIRRWGKGK